MAKIIKYKFLSAQINHGTEQSPDIEQIIYDVQIVCRTPAIFEANYPIAEKEAIAGTIEVTGAFEEEENAATTDDVLNTLLGVRV